MSFPDPELVGRSETKIPYNGLLFLFLAIAALFFGFYGQEKTSANKDDIVVSGTVIDIGRTIGYKRQVVYKPVVLYVDPSTGEPHRATSYTSFNDPPELTSSMDVAFPPANPSAGKVISSAGHFQEMAWAGALVLFGLAAMTLRSSLRPRHDDVSSLTAIEAS